jgi:hypothetical protein
VVAAEVAGLSRGVRSGCRAHRGPYSAGEAYERIGVEGNHVVSAIGAAADGGPWVPSR